MGTLIEKIKHAFAVDPPGPAEPTPEQQPAVDWVCREVARRHLTTPGLIALEMARPLNFVAAQAMYFVAPAVWAVARHQTHEQYTHFARFLERRGSFEHLCRRIEHFEHEFERQAHEKTMKAQQASARPAASDDGSTDEDDRGSAPDPRGKA